MKTFKIGDVVFLKSGSPKMTVKCDDPNTVKILCNWYYEGDIKEKSFYEDQLEIADEDDSSFL